MTIARCDCGLPLHYSDPAVQAFVEREIERMGPTVMVTVSDWGTWMVPRHYIALHGLKASEIPLLAEVYGWTPVLPPAA